MCKPCLNQLTLILQQLSVWEMRAFSVEAFVIIRRPSDKTKATQSWDKVLMNEILHQLICKYSITVTLFTCFFQSQPSTVSMLNSIFCMRKPTIWTHWSWNTKQFPWSSIGCISFFCGKGTYLITPTQCLCTFYIILSPIWDYIMRIHSTDKI